MKKWLLAIVFGSVLVLGACGGGDDGAKDNNTNGGDSVATAEAAYKKSCAQCHGGDLSGGAGPSLEKAGADHSAADIEDIIEKGQGGMPAQKQVSAEDRTEIANWLAEKK